jgi:hypothetical protein
MKMNLKGALVLLSGVALLYSSCKKDSKAPATQTSTKTASLDVVSSQVALNLYQSLSGAYGGVNLNNGIAAPGIASNASTKAVNSLTTTATCGFFLDPAVDIKVNIGDTIKSETVGSIDFYFKCNPTGQHFGFTNDDSLYTVGKAPGYAYTFNSTQQYNVTAMNANNRLFSVGGNIKAFVDFTYPKTYPPLSVHDRIFFKGIVFDLEKDDINAGTATFTSTGTVGGASWSVDGTAEFLGNHKIRITIAGFTFTVNYLTGKVTTP